LRVKGRLVYLLDGLGGLLGEVPYQALQDGPGDVLLEPCLIHGGAVDPAVPALPRPLDSLEDAGLPHGFEEVDDAGSVYGVGLELGVDSVPYGFGAEALGGGPDGSEGELLVVLQDRPQVGFSGVELDSVRHRSIIYCHLFINIPYLKQ